MDFVYRNNLELSLINFDANISIIYYVNYRLYSKIIQQYYYSTLYPNVKVEKNIMKAY